MSETPQEKLQRAKDSGRIIREVKSFVVRQGRLTKGQEAAIEEFWPTMGLEHQTQTFDWPTIFGNANPVILEIGFGMGKSLVAMAKAAPEKNFVGIEVHHPGVGACLKEASDAGLQNLKLISHDAMEILKDSIADGSLAGVQLFFPDPWHKKRHHKRRIVQPEFAQLLRQKLAIDGVFHMATDWENYAQHMAEVMNSAPGFQNIAQDSDYVPRPDFRPLTKFEERGHNLGHGVWDLMYKKIS
ncbi:tRNA (guanosine(46)-N7)-methyltransferase TrmB [Catenovulum sp. 2E275]|uniref:tRNA (guanosine(46)-N7)-methyltransferase TrmB n=1 Tax=Catenovulum sp. 2E275 TaxID=2980497 RepID=UPI0021CE0721|nr:tRNA (guanosine(46)-N7)-methyltransferase TrmB [Catenovulum sp. 2E275]MCU4676104.1 tRNA (guanosine(46)-N7)-methyltransferase TrmB [Catenovulum sp. 2E275]